MRGWPKCVPRTRAAARLGGAGSESGGAGGARGADARGGERGDGANGDGERGRGRAEQDAAEDREAQEEGEDAALVGLTSASFGHCDSTGAAEAAGGI
jgi:hypothetical protein